MNKFLKGALVLLPALALVGGISNSVIADHHGGKRGKKGTDCGHSKKGSKHMHMDAEHMLMMLSYKLDLTDAQELSLKDIVARYDTDHDRGQRRAMDEMMDDLAKLEPGSDAYNQQIDTIAQARSEGLAARMKAKGQMQADILALLNDEQRNEYRRLIDDK